MLRSFLIEQQVDFPCIFPPMSTYEQALEALAYLRSVTSSEPRIGIILGTGLGGLVKEIENPTFVSYDSIPHFSVSTVESHVGRLVFGSIHNVEVVAMQGRFHAYEGYSLQDITFPVRVMRHLGVTTLIISNACGGMNPLYRRGDIMVIDDHINLLGDNPLVGRNDERYGPRFPDMSEPYSRRLISLAEQVALEQGVRLHRGVYVAVQGPNLETRAEYRFLRTIGADVVGMSTVPETIVARHMGMDVLGFSIITDECFPDSLQPVHLEDVLAAAAVAEPVMTSSIASVVQRIEHH